MGTHDKTAKVIDTVLKMTAASAALGTAMVLPNVLIGLDRPLELLYKKLDTREREREARRIIYSMKTQGYLAGEYEHGLMLTKKGQKRLSRLELDELLIEQPKVWDKKWRLVIYDIPENHKKERDLLAARLRRIGFFQLQRSTWIHPLSCREVIQKITLAYGVDRYITYLECDNLDNQKVLISRFRKKLNKTKF